MMSKVTLWKKKMDEYYTEVNTVGLQHDLESSGFKAMGVLPPSSDVFALHEVAVTVEVEETHDGNKLVAPVSYAL